MAGAAVGDGGQGGDGGTRKQQGKGDAVVSPFYWGLGKCYWGLRKNIGEREIKNQSVGASFISRKGGKRKGENQSVGVALSGQTPHPQTSHLHS